MIWHNVEQNSDDWFSIRLGKPTASNFGIIMANEGKAFGEPAKKYALQIALERATGKKAEFSFSNEHMERGQAQEPIARMLYESEKFVQVTNGGFFDCGMYGSSPDGIVCENGLIEIKSVIATTHYSTMKRESFDPSYKWQITGHLMCSGLDYVDFCSYCSDFPEDSQLIVHRVFSDDIKEEKNRLNARLSEFLDMVDSIRCDF